MHMKLTCLLPKVSADVFAKMQELLQFHVVTVIPSASALTFHLSNLIFLF